MARKEKPATLVTSDTTHKLKNFEVKAWQVGEPSSFKSAPSWIKDLDIKQDGQTLMLHLPTGGEVDMKVELYNGCWIVVREEPYGPQVMNDDAFKEHYEAL